MVRHKPRKSELEYDARTRLADYLQSIGEVPVAANARASAMRENAGSLGTVGEWNGTRSFVSPGIMCTWTYSTPLLQLGVHTSRTRSSTPAQVPGHSRSDAGPSDLGAHEECHSFDQDLHAPSPDLPHCTVGSRQTGQCEHIKPDPLEQEPTEDDPCAIIWLPNLQTTQGFIEALRLASLKKSGMQPEDIENLRDPGPVLDLEDPSPLLRSLRHFINNSGSSRAHYEGIREIELLNNPLDVIMSFDQVRHRLSWLSGVMPLEHDMCPNTCVAYTGPYEVMNSMYSHQGRSQG